MAVTDADENDYRVCATQLLIVRVMAKAASQSCATALQL
jgi:hypothetical protein